MFLIEDIILDLINSNPFEYFYELFDNFYKGNYFESEFDNHILTVNGDGMSFFC